MFHFITIIQVTQQSTLMQLVEEQDKENQEHTSFQLIEMVGPNHRYQLCSLIVWCLIWYITGCILLGTPFLVYIEPYDCQNSEHYRNQSLSCKQYVCSLDKTERLLYSPKSQILNIGTSVLSSDVRCEDQWLLDLTESLVYFGSFFGYCLLSMLSDNIGRKKSILICFGIAYIGAIIVCFSHNMYFTFVGLFIMGFGSDVAINICFYFIAETVSDRSRMKHSVLIQFFFSFGCLVNVGYYYWIRDWRIIYLCFIILPGTICLLIILLFIQQTPYFLILKTPQDEILSKLLKIAKFNQVKTDKDALQREVQILKQQYTRSKELQLPKISQSNNENPETTAQNRNHHTFTAVDLFRYRSIRFISISICLLSFFIYIAYYAPLLLINKFSFSVYTNAIVVSLSEIVIYPFCYFLIHRWKRRTTCFIFSVISGIISLLLLFVIRFLCDQGEDYQYCQFLNVIELILVFSFRFCASMQFAIFLIYCNQLLPTQVRGIGIGFSSALGTIASTSAPYIFGTQINSNERMSNCMIGFGIISFISAFLYFKLPETLGGKISDEIMELKEQGKVQWNNKKHMIEIQSEKRDIIQF